MSRNYGAGTRSLAQAGRIHLDRARKHGVIGFGTVAANSERWRLFSGYVKARGIGRMERITRDHLVRYGQYLAGQVHEADLSPAHAQNCVSAINAVMRLVRPDWKTVSPMRDCAIPKRA